MTTFEAIEIIEGPTKRDGEDLIEAWQFLIDTGVCWQLQGWYGREAMRLIRERICIHPEETQNENR